MLQDFEQAVLSLKHSGALAVSAANEIVVQKSLNKHTTFYSQMFEPFLLAYWVSSNYYLHCAPQTTRNSPAVVLVSF